MASEAVSDATENKQHETSAEIQAKLVKWAREAFPYGMNILFILAECLHGDDDADSLFPRILIYYFFNVMIIIIIISLE